MRRIIPLMMMLLYVFQSFVSGQELSEVRATKLERLAEESLATDPQSKSFHGLFMSFQDSPDILNEIRGIDIRTLNSLADSSVHGIVLLAIAVGKETGTLAVDVIMPLSLRAMIHAPQKSIAFGEMAPFYNYWNSFDQWDAFIANIDKLDDLLQDQSIADSVFINLKGANLLSVIKSDKFYLLSMYIQTNLLRRGFSCKLVDLVCPQWQDSLIKYYESGSALGGLFYFDYSQARGKEFRQRLLEFIIKYQDDKTTIGILPLYAEKELKLINLHSLPINDKTRVYLEVAVGGNNNKNTRQ